MTSVLPDPTLDVNLRGPLDEQELVEAEHMRRENLSSCETSHCPRQGRSPTVRDEERQSNKAMERDVGSTGYSSKIFGRRLSGSQWAARGQRNVRSSARLIFGRLWRSQIQSRKTWATGTELGIWDIPRNCRLPGRKSRRDHVRNQKKREYFVRSGLAMPASSSSALSTIWGKQVMNISISSQPLGPSDWLKTSLNAVRCSIWSPPLR
jgi:hypothetical protein